MYRIKFGGSYLTEVGGFSSFTFNSVDKATIYDTMSSLLNAINRNGKHNVFHGDLIVEEIEQVPQVQYRVIRTLP